MNGNDHVFSNSGMTAAENTVFQHLRIAANAYAALPVTHSSEPAEFVAAIHRAQDLLAARIVRRDYPHTWKGNVE